MAITFISTKKHLRLNNIQSILVSLVPGMNSFKDGLVVPLITPQLITPQSTLYEADSFM